MLGAVRGQRESQSQLAKSGGCGSTGSIRSPSRSCYLRLHRDGREQHPSHRDEVQFQRLRVKANPRARGAFGPQTHRCGQPRALAPQNFSSYVWVFSFAQTSGLNSLARRDSTLPRAKRHSRPHTRPALPLPRGTPVPQVSRPRLGSSGCLGSQSCSLHQISRLQGCEFWTVHGPDRGSRASRGRDARPPDRGPGGAHSSWCEQVRFHGPSTQPKTSAGTSGHQALGAFASFGGLCPCGNHLKGPLPSQQPCLCTLRL